METSANIKAINNLLNVESYLSLLMDVAAEHGVKGTTTFNESEEQEQVTQLHKRLSRPQGD